MDRKKIFRCIRIALYIVLAITLFILKFTDILNSTCHIYENFGVLCPSCGITRATKALLDLNFPLAVTYNSYYTLILFPVLFVLLIDDIISIAKKKTSFVDIIFGEQEENRG